jgi:hypothetical protein
LKKAFFYLWFSGLNQASAIQSIRDNLPLDTYLEELILFVETSSRGISRKPAPPFNLKNRSIRQPMPEVSTIE